VRQKDDGIDDDVSLAGPEALIAAPRRTRATDPRAT